MNCAPSSRISSSDHELDVAADPQLAEQYGRFVEVFLQRLAEQVERMKQFNVDARYNYLVTFQRNLTQAAVEKPAVTYRHKTLIEQFQVWSETGRLNGDDESETMIPSG
jgi:hypothetical protein